MDSIRAVWSRRIFQKKKDLSMTKQLVVTDAKVFVPANKFEMSLAFYQALGWEVVGLDEGLEDLRIGVYRFFFASLLPTWMGK